MKLSKRTNPQKNCHFDFFSKLKIPTKALEGSKWVFLIPLGGVIAS
jgi:hypothetical protein